jgi:hypothetical protein
MAADLLILKQNQRKVISGDPFTLITHIKYHLNKSDYPKYEIVLGNTPGFMSVDAYVKKHRKLW